jgi:Glycosyl transferase family 2
MTDPSLRKTSLQEQSAEVSALRRSPMPIGSRKAGLREYLSQKRLHFKFLSGKFLFRIRHFRIQLKAPRSRSYYIYQLYRLSLKCHGTELGILRQYSPRPLQITAPRISKKPKAAPPTIAIVTPSYNQGHLIRETVESVLAQDYPHFQYGIVDGGSTDGTKEVLAEYRHRLDYCVSESDGGQSHAIAKGFNHLSGDIMSYLNSDDLLMPGTLQLVGELFATRSNIDVIYGHRVIIDERGREVGRWVLPRHDAQAIRHFDYIPQETLFWRRSLYDAVGGISPSFRFAMDWDLLLRFINAGARFHRAPYFLACFRIHSEQKTHRLVDTVGKDEKAYLIAREHPDGYHLERVNDLNRSYQIRSSLCATLLKCGIRY